MRISTTDGEYVFDVLETTEHVERDHSSEISGASVLYLVGLLTAKDAPISLSSLFLLTYRNFTDATSLLHLLLQRFRVPRGREDGTAIKMKVWTILKGVFFFRYINIYI